MRKAILNDTPSDTLCVPHPSEREAFVAPTIDSIITEIIRRLAEGSVHSLRPVINGTGIPLHTNLGRAAMPECVAELIKQTAMEYSTLEYDVESGARGSRHSHVEALLCELTGAEAAMVVNNNAAAVMLVLSALCRGREAVVSRGELVEIGGSFRVPEVMEQSGAILCEVGSTNKTHIGDYTNAIGEQTAALLKVHTSNYRIVGFTAEVGIAELCALGRERGVPVIYDVGSGKIRNVDCEMRNEPTVVDGVSAGADVVLFSGDKLLGGPQAGIAVGKREFIEKMKRHPLARAVRIDKLSLAALEGTLRLYAAGKEKEIPTVAMLAATQDELRVKAERLAEMIAGCDIFSTLSFSVCVESTVGEVGGGSLPGVDLPSWAIVVKKCENQDVKSSISVVELERYLRCREIPIIGRISRDAYLLDVRCINERHFDEIVRAFGELKKSI
jgi:L-seryl-tRNA(Ser) seleniumtransferase